jgi:uncharacterized protein (DUF342 family)
MSDDAAAKVLNYDGRYRFEVSADGMEAFLTIFPPIGTRKLPDATEIITALQAAGITYGIREDSIRDAVLQGNGKPVRIAAGVKSVPGKDAEFIFYFKTGVFRKAAIEDGYGKLDLGQVEVVQNVEAGQVIAEKIAAGPGQAGRDVYGKMIPPKPGSDVELVLGPNVFCLNSEQTKLIATAAGEPVLSNGRIGVYPVQVIKSDVNIETGNIEFAGNVVIFGNVEIGMRVEAEGEICIYGSVDAATIKAGGNLFIRGGVYGRGKAVLDCEGDCSVRFLDNATLNSRGYLSVHEYIMNAQVNADLKVVVEGGKGQIVGGLVRSGQEILAKVVGSRLGIQTQLEVGTPPRIKLEYQETEAMLRESQISLDKADKAIAMLKQVPNLPDDKRQILESLMNTAEILKKRIADAENKKEELGAEIIKSSSQNGRIRALEFIYPGVVVTMGRTTFRVQEEIRYTTLVYQDRDIKALPYY